MLLAKRTLVNMIISDRKNGNVKSHVEPVLVIGSITGFIGFVISVGVISMEDISSSDCLRLAST